MLTAKQRSELHAAVVEYLESRGAEFSDSAAAFRRESGVGDGDCASGNPTPLLERKWGTIVRLQQRAMELEDRVRVLEADLKAATKALQDGGVLVAAAAGAGPAAFVPRAPALHTLSGHRGAVTAVAFHPTFNVVASASDDATIKVWDVESGEFERSLKGHTNSVSWLTFDRSGRVLASCGTDLTIRLWRFGEGYTCFRTLVGHEHSVSCVEFVGGSDHLVSASRDKTVRLWDVSTGFCIATLLGHEDWVRRVAVDTAGVLAASASNDTTIRVWTLPTSVSVASVRPSADSVILRGHTHVVEALAFASEPQAATLSRVLLKLSILDSAAPGGDAAGGRGGRAAGGAAHYLVSGGRDRTVRVWDVDVGTCISVLEGHGSWVRGVVFELCGRLVVSVGEDKTLRVWDVEGGKSVCVLDDIHGSFVTAVAIHPRQAVIVTASVDKTLRVWGCRSV